LSASGSLASPASKRRASSVWRSPGTSKGSAPAAIDEAAEAAASAAEAGVSAADAVPWAGSAAPPAGTAAPAPGPVSWPASARQARHPSTAATSNASTMAAVTAGRGKRSKAAIIAASQAGRL